MNKLNRLNNMDDIRLTKEFIFLNPYKFIVYFIYAILGLITAVCIFLSFTKKQETIDVQGYLQRTDKVQDIQIYIDGVVDDVYVQDGEYVEEGETILSLQSDKLDLQKEDLEKNLEEAKGQMELVNRLEDCILNRTNRYQNNEEEGQFYAQIEQYLTQVAALESGVSDSTVNSLSEQKARYQELLSAMQNGGALSEGHAYTTQLQIYQKQVDAYNLNIADLEALVNESEDPVIKGQYEQQLKTYKTERENYIDQQQLSVQQQIGTLDQQLTQAKNSNSDARKSAQAEIDNLQASALVEAKNQGQQLQASIDEYEASIASIDSDLNYYTVKALEAGYIYYKLDLTKDTTLTSGSIVGILTSGETRTDNFQVTLNVPSSGIGFVKNGQNVKLTVDGLDSRDYGYINGEVQKIYETPVQTENAVYYMIETSVRLEENEGIYRELFTLKDDMSVQANIETKETSWMTYILQKINILKDEEDSGE